MRCIAYRRKLPSLPSESGAGESARKRTKRERRERKKGEREADLEWAAQWVAYEYGELIELIVYIVEVNVFITLKTLKKIRYLITLA